MRQKSKASDPIDRVTSFAMKQLSRRGFLKSVGGIGLTLAGVLAGLGKPKVAEAITCPPTAVGTCDQCYSACISGVGDAVVAVLVVTAHLQE